MFCLFVDSDSLIPRQDVQHEDGGAQQTPLHTGQRAVPTEVDPRVSPGGGRGELPGGGGPAEESLHHLHQPGEPAGRGLSPRQPLQQPLQVGQCEVNTQQQTQAGEGGETWPVSDSADHPG